MQILTHPRDEIEDKKILVQQVSDYLEHQYSPSHAVLDGNDYSKDNSILEEFKHLAFQWDRRKPRDRVPPHATELMNDHLCFNLIGYREDSWSWKRFVFRLNYGAQVSSCLSTTKSIHFDSLRQKCSELRRDAPFRNLPSRPLAVGELDAQLFAMQTARSIFGTELLTESLRRHPLPRYPYPEYTLFLQQLVRVFL